MNKKTFFIWTISFFAAYFIAGIFLSLYKAPEHQNASVIPVQSSRGNYVAQENVPPPYSGPSIDEVKSIHVSYGAYLSSNFDNILEEVRTSDVNSIIFEIKNPLGWVAIDSERHLLVLEELLKELNEEGIHTVARLVLFQDPLLIEENPQLAIYNINTGAPWQDYKGITWSDPTQQEVWEHIVGISQRVVKLGFREVNFDYVRFPTDGPLGSARYANMDEFGSRKNTIVAFLKFARENLPRDTVISVDVFGMAFLNDQLVIGQAISEMAPYVDVIYPMPYPSHYPAGFQGFANPAQHPYEIIYHTLSVGKNKLGDSDVIIRPWLQDFNLGAVYDTPMIHAQIKALEDHDIHTWALWNAANRYTWQAVR